MIITIYSLQRIECAKNRRPWQKFSIKSYSNMYIEIHEIINTAY